VGTPQKCQPGFAALPGTLAAIAPARRAARLDVLNALQYV
jgi:ABC-type lipoprotein release transport system permease subunit